MKKKSQTRNLPVRARLIIFSTVMLAMIIGLSVLGIKMVNVTNQAHAARYDGYAQGELDLIKATSEFHQIKVHARNMLYLYADNAEKQQAEIETIRENIAAAEEDMASFKERMIRHMGAVSPEYTECMTHISEYETSIDNMINLVNSHNLEGARAELLSNGVSSANAAEAVINDIAASMEKESESASAAIEKQVYDLRTTIFVICVVAFIVIFIYIFRIIRSITVPVDRLKAAARKLAEGDVDVELVKYRNDDMGQLMDEFEEMKTAIKDQAEIAEKIAGGDLTVKVATRGEKDLLGKALYRLVADNNVTLGNIRESTMQVTVGSEQVATASQSLAQGSTEQASALEQVTASMNDIAEHTKENASEASQADELVHSVKNMAVSGNDQMKAMIQAMNDINESSETISKIIKVIDDIAFQTNILALNAAVEAARAGVHGKGFAVVAEEVRNLAAKSASAASETAEMIEDSIRKVNHGTKLAEETAQALDEIVNSIDQIVNLISDIATASNEQATAVSQIDQAIGQVSQVVQTNSATSEQCAAASEELSNQAANLRSLMANYKLLSAGGRSFEEPMNSVYHSGASNEQIISLDGEFGKY